MKLTKAEAAAMREVRYEDGTVDEALARKLVKRGLAYWVGGTLFPTPDGKAALDEYEYEQGEGWLETIAALRVGEQIDVPPNAYVKKKGRGEYVLHDRSNKFRNRWGNLSQITEDVEHYVQHGALPPPSGGRW